MFFDPRSTRTIILSCIAVQNHEDLILGKNLDFYRHFLVVINKIRLDREEIEIIFRKFFLKF